MPSTLLTHSYLALAALAPATTAATVTPGHPARDTGAPPPHHRVLHGSAVALAPVTTRVRAERTDGGVSLTFA